VLEAVDLTHRLIKPGSSDPFIVVGLLIVEGSFGGEIHFSRSDSTGVCRG